MSLYGQLFRYRCTDDRTPLEDFLTEAIADLLNRLPLNVLVDFVHVLFIRDSVSMALIAPILRSGAIIHWETQRRIQAFGSTYILDLVLTVDSAPVIVVENKLWSPVAEHSNRGVVLGNLDNVSGCEGYDSGIQPAEYLFFRNQLKTYGYWLSCNTIDVCFSAIILLTHGTPPPKGFCASPLEYRVTYANVCRWSEVWRWLMEQPTELGAPSAWRVLANELANFIKERGMSSDPMTLTDVSCAHVFLSTKTKDRIDNTFSAISEKAGPVLDRLGNGKVYDTSYNCEGSVIWAWKYIKPPYAPTPKDWFISWGILFPSSSSWWQEAHPRLPTDTCVFVVLGSDSESIQISELRTEDLLDGWSTSDECELITARSLNTFPTDPLDMTEHISTWVSGEVERILPTISQLALTAGQ